jgi:hypothetical protein
MNKKQTLVYGCEVYFICSDDYHFYCYKFMDNYLNCGNKNLFLLLVPSDLKFMYHMIWMKMFPVCILVCRHRSDHLAQVIF